VADLLRSDENRVIAESALADRPDLLSYEGKVIVELH
jgi:hypothetical protein